MDMSLFDQNPDDLKASRGKRDHHNKKSYPGQEFDIDLRKKANRRDRPRQRHFDPDGDEE